MAEVPTALTPMRRLRVDAGGGDGLLLPLGRRERHERWLSLLSPVLLLLAWEALVAAGALDERFFSRPSRIAGEFLQLTLSGVLPEYVGISLLRVLAGFLAGAVPGVLLGLTMGLFPWVRALVEPVVLALYPIPKIALLPLIMLVFGPGEAFKVVTIALGCFFLVVVNTLAGVLQIDPIYLDVARNFGASRRDVYLTIALPGALPMIVAGLKLALGVALLLIVAAEMIGASSGIGFLIWTSYQVFDLEQMYVGLIVMMFLGALSNLAMNELEKRLVPWRQG